MEHCPCGSAKTYALCCGALISGERAAATPEELMRSRYTAYTLAKMDYLLRTMRPPASERFQPGEAEIEEAQPTRWLKLEILETQTEDARGTVTFAAYYSHHNQAYRMQERSEFKLENQQWYYVDGQLKTTKLSPNDPCPCGGQKKYKKCCGQG